MKNALKRWIYKSLSRTWDRRLMAQKRQRAMELEREFAGRRNAKAYEKVLCVYTITWVTGLIFAILYLLADDSVSKILTAPVVLFPSILLYEYLRFADYMDSNHDSLKKSNKQLINPWLAYSIIVFTIAIGIRGIALLSWKNLLLLSVPIVASWMYFFIRYSSDFKRRKWSSSALFLMMLVVYVPFSFIALNAAFDTSAVQEYSAEVYDKYSGKFGQSLGVVLPDGTEHILDVSLGFYWEIEIGDHVIVCKQNGALNSPYQYIAGRAG